MGKNKRGHRKKRKRRRRPRRWQEIFESLGGESKVLIVRNRGEAYVRLKGTSMSASHSGMEGHPDPDRNLKEALLLLEHKVKAKEEKEKIRERRRKKLEEEALSGE